jgi:glutamine synthetase
MIFNEMRSKTKTIEKAAGLDPSEYPDWSYDGSSTGQASGNNSDCILQCAASQPPGPCSSALAARHPALALPGSLAAMPAVAVAAGGSTSTSPPPPPAPPSRPVRVVPDPIRGAPHVLVMCEVLSPDGTPHPTNTRAKLSALIDDEVKAAACLYGFEQEYTMLNAKTGRIYGWPEAGYPAPQGPFYCGVGPTSVFGRPLAEAHLEACMKAGLGISGGRRAAAPARRLPAAQALP